MGAGRVFRAGGLDVFEEGEAGKEREEGELLLRSRRFWELFAFVDNDDEKDMSEDRWPHLACRVRGLVGPMLMLGCPF